jgi:hypothetical protein
MEVKYKKGIYGLMALLVPLHCVDILPSKRIWLFDGCEHSPVFVCVLVYNL